MEKFSTRPPNVTRKSQTEVEVQASCSEIWRTCTSSSGIHRFVGVEKRKTSLPAITLRGTNILEWKRNMALTAGKFENFGLLMKMADNETCSVPILISMNCL